MQNSTNMRILELLRFLYERTDENHPATVSDIIAHLNGKGIQAVRQTVYADTNAQPSGIPRSPGKLGTSQLDGRLCSHPLRSQRCGAEDQSILWNG